MKALSIVSLIWFVLNFLLIAVFLDGSQEGAEVAAVLGLLAGLYGLLFSILALIISSKRKKTPVNVHEQLLQLGELKEKNIISEYEFDQKKEKLLSKYR
ncbi:SHOCT domain-containing protein [Paenibacillus xylanexedens]|uniref:Multisubunit Na+/H+ antiporter MnhB subunit n=1 Tax=Paenibacillus xylanexedens TaxID=528191 RepID=A0ABS4RMV2_PAEXY|nr:SHOCT domain-containing protein [Paenibacillus xylanexedens]MBP2244233.1 multisubunit Na+/H+ antiporter MnhB subunit [Paenibacillus xylanexedens]